MMSERERWIVYPLLFFAILLAARARFPQPSDLECRTLRCNELIVQAMNEAPRIRIASSRSHSGQIELFGSDGQLALRLHTDPSGRRGALETLDDRQRLRSEIGASSGGGFVKLYGKNTLPSLFLGHDGGREVSGLLALREKQNPKESHVLMWGLPIIWEQTGALTGNGTASENEPGTPPADAPANQPPSGNGSPDPPPDTRVPAPAAQPETAGERHDPETKPAENESSESAAP